VAFTFNLRFPGQYYDAETGLSYNYFRDYDPRTGRYVESDPVGLRGGLGVYLYTENSPLIGRDIFGLRGMSPLDRCPQGWIKHWDDWNGFSCVRDTPDPSAQYCHTWECRVYPAETNCTCTNKCYKTVTGGGKWGSLAVGMICARATGVPVLSGVACNAEIWMACGAACHDKCSGKKGHCN